MRDFSCWKYLHEMPPADLAKTQNNYQHFRCFVECLRVHSLGEPASGGREIQLPMIQLLRVIDCNTRYDGLKNESGTLGLFLGRFRRLPAHQKKRKFGNRGRT